MGSATPEISWSIAMKITRDVVRKRVKTAIFAVSFFRSWSSGRRASAKRGRKLHALRRGGVKEVALLAISVIHCHATKTEKIPKRSPNFSGKRNFSGLHARRKKAEMIAKERETYTALCETGQARAYRTRDAASPFAM
jgi:hypothetical protein